MNWYAYVGDRPTMGVDPEGEDGPLGPVSPPRPPSRPCPAKPKHKPKDPCKEACYRQFHIDKFFCNAEASVEGAVCTALFSLCVSGSDGVVTPACVWSYRICMGAVLARHLLCLAHAEANPNASLDRCGDKGSDTYR